MHFTFHWRNGHDLSFVINPLARNGIYGLNEIGSLIKQYSFTLTVQIWDVLPNHKLGWHRVEKAFCLWVPLLKIFWIGILIICFSTSGNVSSSNSIPEVEYYTLSATKIMKHRVDNEYDQQNVSKLFNTHDQE